ncbi:MAG TPA: hypothetical protein VJU87_09620 [Gemmatimonadaceae bacterium]|nr:hypothetical protein [Gemmatimonadaceae bacterium]
MIDPLLQPFTFEADDRTFACQIEQARAHPAQPWWWFTVSGESHRYAPFHSVTGDTVESVRSRVLTYYRELVARRALSLDQRESWELRRKNLAALKTVRER